MITKENFKLVFKMLTDSGLLQQEMEKPHDYVKLELNIFNGGSTIDFISVDYDVAEQAETVANGNIYTDKDSFQNLLDEYYKSIPKVKFKDWECDVELSKYVANDQVAIMLTHPEDGPIATATVYLEQVPLSKEAIDSKLTFIKTWSENEGIFEALLKSGIIEDLHEKFKLNEFGSVAKLVRVLI